MTTESGLLFWATLYYTCKKQNTGRDIQSGGFRNGKTTYTAFNCICGTTLTICLITRLHQIAHYPRSDAERYDYSVLSIGRSAKVFTSLILALLSRFSDDDDDDDDEYNAV